MKKSIRTRIAVVFIALMAAFLIGIGLCANFFLEKVYMSEKKEQLLKSWNTICDSKGTLSEDTIQFCSSNSLVYALVDENLTTMQTNAREPKEMAGRLLGNLLGKEEDNSRILENTEDYQILIVQDRFERIDYLEMWGRLDNGSYYIVMSPVQSISEAAHISVRFYLLLGALAMLCSGISIWIITSRIVKPIRELSGLSERMAGLDFSAHYESGGEDEIGILGENFNRMSDNLEKAMGELKSANTRLEVDLAEKIQIDEMRREFLGNVSHELKTPIALIQGYAEGLRDGISESPEDAEFYCDVIIDEAQKMNTMVKQLLSLNQLESGENQMQMERFDLCEVVEGVLQSSRLLLEQSGANVIFEPQHSWYVWADEFRIEEVITNFLTNAIHHLEGEKRIEIRVREENGVVITSVFNTGKPIPKEDLERIWDKFYKVDKARTRAYGGSGIGLSIVKAIMDAHAQTCRVVNYDDGVEFSFTLESSL
ncbi:MAG: ATP-binding protein [Eubacteriales bacterium]|nr:ATP-binding protein [Eubacteriales bacterium]